MKVKYHKVGKIKLKLNKETKKITNTKIQNENEKKIQ